MPRPSMPLTPAASTEIPGREDACVPPPDQSFDLPPPALAAQRKDTEAASTHQPTQPAIASAYSLPPPPTRSRTIIQMTPRAPLQDAPKRAPQAILKASSKRLKASAATSATAKKQPSSTSAAGRKIARKTAHSVIERRRRSKMNEEFGTLKDMIPACSGQDMHKLAILQATIDYLRYLESCVKDLSAANNALSTPLVQPQALSLRTYNVALDSSDDEDEDNGRASELEAQDEAMEDVYQPAAAQVELTKAQSAAIVTPQSSLHLPEEDYHFRRHRDSYASTVSSLPSPMFGPQRRPQSQHSISAYSSASTTTSPTILPNTEQDEEATAALLMLTHDRRHLPSQAKAKKGLSVKDLLTH